MFVNHLGMSIIHFEDFSGEACLTWIRGGILQENATKGL